LGKASTSPFNPLLARVPSNLKAKGDIVGNSAPRKQIETLPHRSHPRCAGSDTCLSVNTSDNLQQRALAATTRSDHGSHLARTNAKTDALERLNWCSRFCAIRQADVVASDGDACACHAVLT
jgi:hypothetical protein